LNIIIIHLLNLLPLPTPFTAIITWSSCQRTGVLMLLANSIFNLTAKLAYKLNAACQLSLLALSKVVHGQFLCKTLAPANNGGAVS